MELWIRRSFGVALFFAAAALLILGLLHWKHWEIVIPVTGVCILSGFIACKRRYGNKNVDGNGNVGGGACRANGFNINNVDESWCDKYGNLNKWKALNLHPDKNKDCPEFAESSMKAAYNKCEQLMEGKVETDEAALRRRQEQDWKDDQAFLAKKYGTTWQQTTYDQQQQTTYPSKSKLVPVTHFGRSQTQDDGFSFSKVVDGIADMFKSDEPVRVSSPAEFENIMRNRREAEEAQRRQKEYQESLIKDVLETFGVLGSGLLAAGGLLFTGAGMLGELTLQGVGLAGGLALHGIASGMEGLSGWMLGD